MIPPLRMCRAGLAAVIAVSAPVGQVFAGDDHRPAITLAHGHDRVVVRIDGEPFTEYVFEGHAKPILHPIRGPHGVPMTRSWPIVKDLPDEPHDHPHHESLWFTHGRVNDVDFWMHRPDEAGRRPEVAQVALAILDDERAIESRNEWRRADGTVVMTDTRRIVFWADAAKTQERNAAARGVDYDITLRADRGPVVLGDTKEGTMAIRVHHALQLEDLDGSSGAAGRIVNSEGEKDAKAWGRPARWVDYSGPIEGRTVGITLFDHPDNLRHPTHWHARAYGLLAANPFGLHDFTGAHSGAGDHTIPADGTLRLRYRFVFHDGDADPFDIERRWRRWAGY